MKSLYILLICLFPFTIYSQSDFNYVSHDQWTNYTALAIGETAIVAVGFSEECDRPYISYFDRASGEEIWHRFAPVGSAAYGSYTGVDFAADGSIWAVGWKRENYDVTADKSVFLTHYSTEGNLLIQYTTSDNSVEQALPAVEVLPDGRVLWTEDGYLDIHAPIGQGGTGALLNPNITPLFIAALSSTRFAYTDGISVQIRDEESQLPFYIYSSDTQITSLIADEQAVYWTDGISLYHYDVASETLTNYYIGAIDPLRLAWQDEEVLIYEVLSNEASTWLFSPAAGSFTEAQTWQMPSQQLLQLEWRDDGFYQLGTDIYETPEEGTRPYYHGFVQRTQAFMPPPAADVGVVGINAQIDSVDINVHDLYWYRADITWSCQVEIQNFSNIPVFDSLAIVSTADDGVYCVESRYYGVFPVSIPAQSSVVIDFQFQDTEFVDQDAEGNFIIDEELCFYTIAPDHRVDLNVLNNMYCETFNIVDNEEVMKEKSTLQVFPNPTRDRITLEMPGAFLESLQVYDMLGRAMQAQQIEQANSFEFSMSDYPAGTYWIKLKTDEDFYQQRVVVQE